MTLAIAFHLADASPSLAQRRRHDPRAGRLAGARATGTGASRWPRLRASGPFSRFEGVQRWFAVLCGAVCGCSSTARRAPDHGLERAAGFDGAVAARMPSCSTGPTRGLQPDGAAGPGYGAHERSPARRQFVAAARYALVVCTPTPAPVNCSTSRVRSRCRRTPWPGGSVPAGTRCEVRRRRALDGDRAMTLELWTHAGAPRCRPAPPLPYGLSRTRPWSSRANASPGSARARAARQRCATAAARSTMPAARWSRRA